ncbi:MAG: metal-dependent transcriptional regulator, partial [Bacteroidia bacterium]|nr:metal-dependent transcriptional regulator [Bacteroidia bacterium]
TNAIADEMSTKSASVTDMVKRLALKKLVFYTPYKGVKLTDKGRKKAVDVVRKHRLWEVFLVDTLKFKWDEVHHIAEELEHVNSKELFNRLDKFLGYPKFDPHGDPIPDAKGKLSSMEMKPLADLGLKDKGVICGVLDDSKTFLQYLEKVKLKLGNKVSLVEKHQFDNSIDVKINNRTSVHISNKIARNILVSSNK